MSTLRRARSSRSTSRSLATTAIRFPRTHFAKPRRRAEWSAWRPHRLLAHHERMDDAMVRAFPPTRHSAVAAVRSADTAQRAKGLAILSAVYWRPVYTYLRLRWRKPHEEAADLAQEFFTQVVQKDVFARFDPSRARLRTFLRTCIDGLVANHDKAARRQKRGGGAAPVPLDVSFDFAGAREEIEQLMDTAASPERLFEQEWSRAVFAMALDRLRAECAKG